jgi:hypothetical protein
MFRKLKTKNQRKSVFENRPHPTAFSKSPGATSSVTKANEADRLVRCRHCGWICDKERDVRLPDGSYAGFGINQGAQLTMDASVGDSSSGAQQYFDRTVSSGCPGCGSYTYDPAQRIQQFPTD